MHVRQRLKQFSHKVVESLPKICYEPSTVSSELCLNPHLVGVQISPIKGQHKLIATGFVAVELSCHFTCCCLPSVPPVNLHLLEISWLGSWLRGCGRTGALKGGMLLLVSSSEISEIPKEVKSASGGSQFGSPLTKPPPPPLLDVTGLFIGGNSRLAQ